LVDPRCARRRNAGPTGMVLMPHGQESQRITPTVRRMLWSLRAAPFCLSLVSYRITLFRPIGRGKGSRCLTIGSSNRGAYLRWTKEGVDDCDKTASFYAGANPRRSTSSLGTVIKRALFWAWALLGVPLAYGWVARRMAPPWEWPYSTTVDVGLLISLILFVGSDLLATRQFNARRIDKMGVWVTYVGVMGFLCSIFALPFTHRPRFD
jgi:hypothetical protein